MKQIVLNDLKKEKIGATKDADEMAYSVDTDQTASLGRAVKSVGTICSDLSVLLLRFFMAINFCCRYG